MRDALVHQFEDIDTSDGVLPTGSMEADVAAAHSDDGPIEDIEKLADGELRNLEDLMYQRDSEDYQWERRLPNSYAHSSKSGA